MRPEARIFREQFGQSRRQRALDADRATDAREALGLGLHPQRDFVDGLGDASHVAASPTILDAGLRRCEVAIVFVVVPDDRCEAGVLDAAQGLGQAALQDVAHDPSPSMRML
ncbi:hypothetical protein H8A95_24555 [Bradyrhizobium sp. Pear76]|uniref:hypothetical protein n=1 Tax=Bradyrhizobium oropedii TaxID=1571201 RepID=UPI001E320B2D|nr:hypothetical protein [Bradyrhizobium oropedii]MCC8965401.1 hypothetical protein [Bradyrhizobium oropedii]